MYNVQKIFEVSSSTNSISFPPTKAHKSDDTKLEVSRNAVLRSTRRWEVNGEHGSSNILRLLLSHATLFSSKTCFFLCPTRMLESLAHSAYLPRAVFCGISISSRMKGNEDPSSRRAAVV